MWAPLTLVSVGYWVSGGMWGHRETRNCGSRSVTEGLTLATSRGCGPCRSRLDPPARSCRSLLLWPLHPKQKKHKWKEEWDGFSEQYPRSWSVQHKSVRRDSSTEAQRGRNLWEPHDSIPFQRAIQSYLNTSILSFSLFTLNHPHQNSTSRLTEIVNMMHNVEPDPTKLLQAIIRLRIGLTPLSGDNLSWEKLGCI